MGLKRLPTDSFNRKTGISDLTFLTEDFREEVDWCVNFHQKEFTEFKETYGKFFDEKDLDEMMKALESLKNMSSVVQSKYNDLLRKLHMSEGKSE